MSIKTTHIVTREFAIAAIEKKLLELLDCLPEKTDDELSDILEDAVHNGFYNFSVVSPEEFEETRDGDYYTKRPYLYDLNNLPESNDAY